MTNIREIMSSHKLILGWMMNDDELIATIAKVSKEIAFRLSRRGQKVLVCGNGGSATDASHFVAELVGRFEKDRKPFPAIALTADSAILTAIGNDYGFEHVFDRQVDALGKTGDVLICLSTSGLSQNVINAAIAGIDDGLYVVSITGSLPPEGDRLAISDERIIVPSFTIARIQEMTILILHIICQRIEEELKL